MQKRVAIPLGVLAFLLVAVLLALFVGLPWAKNKAMGIVSEKLGRDVVAEGGIHLAWTWPPGLRIEDLRIANADWSDEPWMAKIETVEASLDVGALTSGNIRIPDLNIVDPWVLLQRNEEGIANWQFKALKSEPSQEKGPSQIPIFEDIDITGGKVLYRAPDQQFTASIPQIQGALTEKKTRLSAEGEIVDSPFSVNVEAGGIAEIQTPDNPFPIDARLDFGNLQASVAGKLAISGDAEDNQLQLKIRGQGEPPLVAVLTGAPAPDLPSYQLNATVDQTDPQRWALDTLNSEFGDSRLQGTGLLDLSGDRPYIKLDADVPQLDIAALQELAPEQNAPAGEASETPSDGKSSDSKSADTNTGLDLTALAGIDADVSIDVQAFQGMDAPVENALLNLSLKEGRLRIDPLSGQIAANELALTADLNVNDVPVTGQISVKADQVDLSQTAQALELEARPPGKLWLDATLNITGQPVAENDLFLPSLGQVRLAPTKLRFEAPSLAASIDATLQTVEGSRLKIDAQGSYRDSPFELDFLGDSPLALRDPERPYSLQATVNAADTRLFAQGKITEPLTQQTLDLRFEIEGPNPERLAPLLEFPLPDLPPYSLAGQLYRKGDEIKVTDFAGEVGDSDLSGDAELNLAGSVPKIDAKLNSDYLDFDDLGGLIGAEPDTGAGETVSPQQQREAAAREESDYLFPREPLNIEAATGAMQADIEYRATRVETDILPLDELYFQVNIGNDRLEIKPLEFNLGKGDIHLELSFDTGRVPIAGSLEGEVRRIDLKRVLAPFDIADESLGQVGGRMRFWMRGDSIYDFLSSADGGLLLVMTGGRLDSLLIELAGLDITESLAALFGNADSVPIDCAYLDLPVKNGIASIETALIDTSDTLFLADGNIYFASETLNVVIEPRPKDFSLLSLRAPVHVEGKMQDPSFIPGGALMGRGIAAAALAAATPIAGLIPLIEPGTGEGSTYCDGLTEAIDRARK
ncbi:AsmA family protein [Pistricoccus aurantiacus]|uniref:AsmA family protein n=1 Tax=Pistricoccus aurantiacus TaxID=1883414 RepID=A0A5B8SUP8_9GAMM|nr:AsmA family protein [Pistricoccus aurantiacus]QEA39777.1 AsmA family protein [Pistricoccus aurantiacus]